MPDGVYHRTIGRFGADVKVYMVPTEEPIATCVLIPGDKEQGVWVGSGISFEKALEVALIRMISFLQARKYGEEFGESPNEVSELEFANFILGEEVSCVTENSNDGEKFLEAVLNLHKDVLVAYATPDALAATTTFQCLRLWILD